MEKESPDMFLDSSGFVHHILLGLMILCDRGRTLCISVIRCLKQQNSEARIEGAVFARNLVA
jgi:hypothetical protein